MKLILKVMSKKFGSTGWDVSEYGFIFTFSDIIEITESLPVAKRNILKILAMFWSNHQRCSIKKGILRNFTKIHRKTPVPTLLKKRLGHRCFPVNFAKFLRTHILQNTSRRMLLYVLRSFRTNMSISFISETFIQGTMYIEC